MPSPLFPDEEALVCEFLRRQPTIAAVVGDRVGTRLNAVFPCIRVTSLGGSTPEWYEWQSAVQVEAWAELYYQQTAKNLALAVMAVVFDLDANYAPQQVSSANIRNGPLFMPDPDTERPRYIVDIELVLHQGAAP